MSYKRINTSISEVGIDKLLRFNYRTTKYKKKIAKNNSNYQNTIRIKSLFNIISGYAFSSNDYVEEGVPIVRIGDLNSYKLNYENMIQVPLEYYDSEKFQGYIVKKGDILVSLTGDGNLKCLYFDEETQLLLNQRVAILRPKKDINIEFYYWLLKTYFVKDQFAYYSNGKSQLNISPFDLANIKVPVINDSIQNTFMEIISPKVKEINKLLASEKKINEIINEVFSKEFSYDINLINEVRKGMTYGTQLSTNSELNSFSCKVSELDSDNMRLSVRANSNIFKRVENLLKQNDYIQIRDVIKEPVHNGAKPLYTEQEAIPVIKTAYLTNNGIDTENVSEFTTIETYEKYPDAHLKNNDILICNIGKCSCGKIDIKEDDIDSFGANEVTIIRTDNKKYNSKFLLYVLRSIFGIFQIEKAYTGTTNQIHLNPKSVEDFIIPNISLDEQEKIVEEIDKKIQIQNDVEKQISKEEEEIEKELTDIIEK